MIFASLPMILYVLPLFVLAAALVPSQRKSGVLALGGLAAAWISGGFTLLVLLLFSVFSAWLMLRTQPQKTESHRRRAEMWLCAGIALQILIILLGRLMLNEMQLIPLLVCAVQSAECLADHTNNRMHTPALYPFFCYQCDLTRLPAGPALEYAAFRQAYENRRVSSENIGKGASKCIRGLFQLVCLAVPMYQLCNALKRNGAQCTAADALFTLLSFYFCAYYGIKGTARIGQGVAQMLGLSFPDSFSDPLLADSLTDFSKRFLTPLHAWYTRVLLPEGGKRETAGFFVRLALLLSGFGVLFRFSSSGILWGILAAGLLTAEYNRKHTPAHPLPPAARRTLTAIIILLSLGLLCSSSLIDSISFYGSLLGVNGIAPSAAAGYLMRANWLIFLLCIVCLLPFRSLRGYLPPLRFLKLLAGCGRAAAELFMLLAAYSALLSRYLRAS